jgi:subtilisin-like proprotein convertase family protein
MNKRRIQNFMHSSAARPHLRRGARQRFALGCLALTLAVSAGLPAIAGDSHRDGRRDHSRQEQEISAEAKRGRKRVVKKTFSSDGAIAIPALGSANDWFAPADPYPSTIQVQGFKRAKIVDVNLTLRNLNHTYSKNVDVLLVAPGGRNAIVMGDAGSDFNALEAEVSNTTVTLDDEVAQPLPEGNGKPLLAGSYQPRNFDGPGSDNFGSPAPTPSGSDALSTFDGINPNGQWRLFIVDDAAHDTGSLAGGWTLEITAKSKKKRR